MNISKIASEEKKSFGIPSRPVLESASARSTSACADNYQQRSEATCLALITKPWKLKTEEKKSRVDQCWRVPRQDQHRHVPTIISKGMRLHAWLSSPSLLETEDGREEVKSFERNEKIQKITDPTGMHLPLMVHSSHGSCENASISIDCCNGLLSTC
jgi:hypothetical protein